MEWSWLELFHNVQSRLTCGKTNKKKNISPLVFNAVISGANILPVLYPNWPEPTS